jgi:hypothetical protein
MGGATAARAAEPQRGSATAGAAEAATTRISRLRAPIEEYHRRG